MPEKSKGNAKEDVIFIPNIPMFASGSSMKDAGYFTLMGFKVMSVGLWSFKLLFVCLVYSKGAQLQLTGIFCYIGYIQTNLYIIQFHNHTWQRVLARKRARRPVEEWSEAHLMGGHFRNSLFPT